MRVKLFENKTTTTRKQLILFYSDENEQATSSLQWAGFLIHRLLLIGLEIPDRLLGFQSLRFIARGT